MATMNQKAVAAKLVAQVKKGEKVSVTAAMRETGMYSVATAKHPEKITQSKGFRALMAEYLGDDKLAAKHRELLEKKIVVHKTTSDGTIVSHVTDEIDHLAVGKALDMAYKLTGQYAPTKSANVNVNINADAPPEVAGLAQEYEERLLQQLMQPSDADGGKTTPKIEV